MAVQTKGRLRSIVVRHVLVDLVHQFAHAAERAAPDCVLGDQREPALDLVEPAGISGGVMHVIARTASEPGFYPRMFVGGVVVGDQMNLEILRDVVIEVLKKGQKLLMPMARLALR